MEQNNQQSCLQAVVLVPTMKGKQIEEIYIPITIDLYKSV